MKYLIAAFIVLCCGCSSMYNVEPLTSNFTGDLDTLEVPDVSTIYVPARPPMQLCEVVQDETVIELPCFSAADAETLSEILQAQTANKQILEQLIYANRALVIGHNSTVQMAKQIEEHRNILAIELAEREKELRWEEDKRLIERSFLFTLLLIALL